MSHSMKIKVYYEDTDAGGVVYHANYLRFMERGRTEMLLEMGVDLARLHNESRVFIVTRVDIRYRSPARLGDTVEIKTELGWCKHASAMLRQQCLRGDTLLAEAEIIVAMLGPSGRPIRLPVEFTSGLDQYNKEATDNT